MFRAGLALVSGCLVAGFAFGPVQAKSSTASGVVAVKVAAAPPVAVLAEVPVVSVTAVVPSAVPNCARRVKVVYQGYGEADRASCGAPTSVEASR